jgi:hypothetical protein
LSAAPEGSDAKTSAHASAAAETARDHRVAIAIVRGSFDAFSRTFPRDAPLLFADAISRGPLSTVSTPRDFLTRQQTRRSPGAPANNRFRAASIHAKKPDPSPHEHTHTRADLVKVVVRSALLK